MKLLKKTLAVIMVILTLFTTYTVAMPVFAENEGVSITEIKENNEPEIISEDINKRTETSKQFLMSDGSYVLAQYNSPVHYLTNENKWIDIDNSLNEAVATTTQSEIFGQSNIIRTNNQATNIVFAEKANSNTFVLFDNEEYPISLNYQSMKNSVGKVAEKDGNLEGDEAYLNLSNLTDEIIYENVYDNVDLQYIVSSNGIKENIILKNVSAQNSFVVNYNIGELSAKAVSKNEIHLLDGKDIIYVISAPVMYDAEGNTSSEIELNITKNKNGKLTFEILPDKTWLANATYPVTIDPYVSEVTDTSIEGVCVNGNSVSTTNFTISYGEAYALLNLVFFTGEPVLDHIVSAKLDLPVVSHTGSRVYARKITESWREDDAETSEYVIVNTNPTVAETVEDYFNITTDADKLSFDLTGLYSEWENGAENNGIKLEMATQGSVQFDITSSSPLLTVNYMSTCGLNATMPYTEYDMGSAGYVYVNNFSGNLIITRDNEISTTGEEYPYDFSMTYNSLAAYDEDNSHWLPSYMSGFSSLIVYTATDGTQELFVEGKDNTREDFYALKENDYGWECLKETEYWTVTLPIVGGTMKIPVAFDACKNNCTEKYSYNTSGLQKITIGENLCSTPKNERVVLSREKIEGSSDFYLVDGSGHKLLVSKTDSTYTLTQYIKNTDGTYTEGESVTYTFDDDGNVTQIKRGDAVEAAFTYVDDKIASITDNENHTVEFEYNGKRITKVTESRGDETGTTVSFERHSNTVTARTAGANGGYGDNDDTHVTSRFSPDLKLLGESYATVSGESLGAVSYDRDDNADSTSAFDGISRVGVMGRNPENLLKNHSVESSANWSDATYLDSSCDFSTSLDSNYVHSGQRSAKITVNDVTKNGGACVYQRLEFEKGEFERGKDYMLSAYIKTDGITRDPDVDSKYSYGATVLARAVKTDGTATAFYGENICLTDSNVDGGWVRVVAYLTVPEDCEKLYLTGFLRNGTGTAYFDSFQLEEGRILSKYNLVENSSFDRADSNGFPTGWIGTEDLESTDVVVNGEFKITGDPDSYKAIYQEIPLKNASQDDTYTLSAWSHGEAVPSKDICEYCLFGLVLYEDAQGNRVNSEGNEFYKDIEPVYYDSNYSGEQFLSTSFDLSTDDETLIPYSIAVAVGYNFGVNDVYFDDVSLVRTNDVIDLTESDIETEDVTDPYTYDENGNILTYTDSDGSVYNYTYDANGNLVSRLKTVTVDGVSTQVGDRYTYVEIDGEYYIKTETYEDGTTYTYDYFDNSNTLEKETIVSEGTTEVYNYDINENLTSYVVDNEVKSSYTYIEKNNSWLLKTETTDGYVTTYNYAENSDELLSKVKTQNAVEVERDDYEYTNGDVTKHTHTENGTSLAYHYGSKGEITKVEHNGFSYDYVYDNFGNTTNVKINDSQSLVQYNYQADKSKLASMTYGNGDMISYTYDNYGGVKKKSLTGLGSYTYYVDDYGKTIYEKDSVSDERTTYLYDFKGNLISEKVYTYDKHNLANKLYETNNRFDDNGNIVFNELAVGDKNYTVNHSYNDDGLPTETAISSSRKVSFAYDDEGVLTGRSLSTNTPVAESFAYSDEGLISTHTVAHGEDSDAYSYTYDDNANITEIKKGNTVQQSYEYDALNQLIRENDRDTNKTVVYEYDNYGNIEKKTEYAFTLGELGTAVDAVDYEYDDTAWNDKLTSYDEQAIAYDEIGNPTDYMGADMTWFGRQMMSYSIENEIDISYTYDADGLRTSKTVNGVVHNYYYVDGQLRYERNGDSYEMYYRYDADGRPVLATKRNLETNKSYQYYLITNTRGDVIETRNGDGNVNARFVYDAWGKLISVTDANGNALSADSFAYQISLKYRGYVYDNETGLYYLQSRYYDPETGRFINADDVEYIGASGTMLGYNAFAYCGNEPVGNSDHNGRSSIDILMLSIKNIFLNLYNKFFKNTLSRYLKNTHQKNQFGKYPLEVNVSNNTIKISVTFRFIGTLQDKRYNDRRFYKTYKKLFLEGIEDYWEEEFTVFGYDVKIKVDAKESKNSGIPVTMHDSYGTSVASLSFNPQSGMYGKIDIYTGDNRTNHFYSENDYKFVAAHEFGHILGVNDIWGTQYESSVVSVFNKINTPVQNVDVEMVLLAFIYNKVITYEDWLRLVK